MACRRVHLVILALGEIPLQFVDRYKALPRDLKLLWTSVFGVMFGLGIYLSSFFNFATEKLSIDPSSMGRLEAIREFPGFLCVLFAALTMHLLEPIVGSIAMLLMAAGLAAYAWVSNLHQLMLCSFIWSAGFHTWTPLQSSLVTNLSGDNNKGKRLGQTASVGCIGTLAGMTVVMTFGVRMGYPALFLTGAAAMALGGLVMLAVRRDIGHSAKPRLVLKRRYSLYYALTLLEGCRKQVFLTFAVYALTKVYQTPLQVVAMLMVINNLINMFGAPIVGKLIDRIGEKAILQVCYTALIFVFIGYATVRKVHVLYVLYCLDNLFFLSSTCLTTYLQKIAEPEDMMPTLSMGVTFNHAAAVLVPLIGGMLWSKLGYPVTFFGGAVVVAISLTLASRVGVSERAEVPA